MGFLDGILAVGRIEMNEAIQPGKSFYHGTIAKTIQAGKPILIQFLELELKTPLYYSGV